MGWEIVGTKESVGKAFGRKCLLVLPKGSVAAEQEQDDRHRGVEAELCSWVSAELNCFLPPEPEVRT